MPLLPTDPEKDWDICPACRAAAESLFSQYHEQMTVTTEPEIGFITPAACSGEVAYKTIDQAEIEYIVKILGRVDWNKSKASKILGIERSTLDRKLKRHNIQRPAYTDSL